MTSALPVCQGLSSRTLMICAVVSLGLHAGLLAGLNMIQRSEPIIETVELVHVTLVPQEIPSDIPSEESPPPTDEPNPVAPPMRTTPRQAPSARHSPPAPTISAPLPLVTPSPPLLTPPPPMAPPAPTMKKRMLNDTLATDALFVQQATKMTQRSNATQAVPASNVPAPSMRVRSMPKRSSLSPATTSINAAPATSQPSRPRRVMTQRPTTSAPGIVKIGVRHSVQPVYPRMAKEEGWEGVVLLQVLVQTNGVPGKITVRKSSGHKILDNAAVDAMRQWRFLPAMDGNFPVEKYVQVPLKFGLHH